MSGGTRIKCGSVMGTGANIDVDTTDFQPRRVTLRNEVSFIELTWTESMADGHAFKRIANGTATKPSSGGITPRAHGFRIGTDSINTAGQTIHWEVHE